MQFPASAFKLASNDFLSKIAQEWNSFFSDENFDTSPCLVCGERLLRKDARIVAKGEFTSDQKFLLQDQSLPTNLLPRHYDFKAWESAIIDPGAIYLENGVEKCRLCTSCYNFLFKSPPQMPPLALANGNYDAYACVPAGVQEAFEAATEIEKLIIGAARASRIHYKLSRKPGSSQFGKPDQVSASYSRGNTIILPQNTVNFQNVIPGNVESFQDAVCILFLGSEPPTEEWINRQQPLIVTKSRVKLLIEWLVNYSGNSVYTKLEVSDSNLRNILREPRGVPSFLLPSFVSNRAELVGQNYASLESLGPRVAGDSTYDPTVSQTTGYIEPTLNRNSMESKIQALRHFRSGKPVFMIPRGQVPIDDLHDPSWLTAVWPHLDPFNLLGFHRKRKVEVTLAAQVAHLLRMHHGRFATDPAFPYIMFNLIQRRENMKRAYYAIPDRSINTFEQDVRSLSPDMLNNLVAKLKKDSAYKPTDPEESVAFNLVRNMRIYNSHANGSDGKRIKFRREIQGMICRHGMYSMFITINPADKNNPLMLKLGGKDVSLADDINTHLFSAWDQEVFAAKRPDISAEFFDTMVQSFLHIVLKVDGTQQGLFGRVKAYHGNCENQGRSTYHMHLVLWLHGHGNPLEMERTIQQDPAFRAKVVAWLEQHIHSHMSSQTQPATVQFDAYSRPERAPGQQNPCTRGQITAPVGSSEFNARVDDLVIENQYHTHGPVCIKGRKAAAASDETCRFRINGSTQAETTTEEALILRRFHGRLTEFNPLMMSLLRCNMHLAYIGYGEFAYSWMMYTTNYTTKGNMPMHEGLAGLCAALSKHKNGENQSARNLLLRTLNQMSARTEICGPQVHRYLTGLEDRYTGDQFATLPWTLFDANIKRLEDLAEQESRSDSGYNEMQIDADLIEQQREDQSELALGSGVF